MSVAAFAPCLQQPGYRAGSRAGGPGPVGRHAGSQAAAQLITTQTAAAQAGGSVKGLIWCTWEGSCSDGGRAAAQCWGVQWLKELNVDVPGPRLVVRIDVRHKRVPGAVYALADNASIFLLSFGVLVGDVPLQGRL